MVWGFQGETDITWTTGGGGVMEQEGLNGMSYQNNRREKLGEEQLTLKIFDNASWKPTTIEAFYNWTVFRD